MLCGQSKTPLHGFKESRQAPQFLLGPTGKKVGSKAFLKYKGKPYKPFINVQKDLLQITYQDEFIISQKTSTTGRLSMKTRPFGHDSYLLYHNYSCVQNGKKQLRNSSFFCAYKKILRNSPTNNFLWHSEKFLLCCIRHN